MEKRRILLCIIVVFYTASMITADEFSCDFEAQNLCNITQDTQHDTFDWIIHSGQTPSHDTGPDKAHSGTYYIYMECSNPRTNSDIASFHLPTIQNAGDHCLDFFYNSNGVPRHLAQLTILQNKESVWENDDSTGLPWHRARIDLILGRNDMITFQGKVRDYGGDVSLDDINLTEGRCFPDIITTTLPTIETTQGEEAIFECDFESSSINKREQICEMYQHDDNFDWVRKAAPAEDGSNGPKDGAHGGKGYISLESDRSSYVLGKGFRSSVSVPRVYKEGKYCLSFWYYMNNETPDSQSVLRLFKNMPQQGDSLWSQEKSQGDKWNKAEIKVELKPSQRVVFEGTIGSSGDGDVALDDIKLIDC